PCAASPLHALPRPASSGRVVPTRTAWPHQLPAPVHRRRRRSASSTLHDDALFRTASAPLLQYRVRPANALLPVCCMTSCPAPSGPGTTAVVAQTRAAVARLPLPAPAVAPAARPRRAVLARSSRPVLPPSAARTNSVTRLPVQMHP